MKRIASQSDRFWLVLGASSPIARAFAAEVAAAGAALLLAGRDRNDLARTAADLRIRHGSTVEVLGFDALDRASQRLLADAVRTVVPEGKLDIFLAFGDMPDQAAMERDPGLAVRAITASFTGAAALLLDLAPLLEAGRQGRVIILSSVAGDRGRLKNYVYGAAKAGLTTFAAGLRNRLFRSGVTVTTVKPGFLDTGMTWGQPGIFLAARPEAAARAMLAAGLKGRGTVYVPRFWALVMLVIRLIPEKIFKRLSIYTTGRSIGGGRVEERNLGKSGLRVTAVGLGCNNFGGRIDLEATRRVVHKALDLGITLFDTADIYGEKGGEKGGSESDLGEALGPRRKDVILATKVGKPMSPRDRGASRLYLMRAVEACLRRLKTDWIDLMQLHEPDPGTPIEESLRAFDDLIRQGKVRYIGASNFAAWQLVEAHWTAKCAGTTGFIASQEEYSLLDRSVEAEIIPALSACGMGLLPFFPLASGLLTGKYRPREAAPEGTRLAREPRMAKRFLTESNIVKVERLTAFCQARGKSLLELAVSWLAAQAAVASVIAGATKPEQLEQNVKAVSWRLSPDEREEIDSITLGK